jgi:dTDP-4-amino-4,6-dideoxygalactose transaminase
MKWKVPYLDLPAQYRAQKNELDDAFKKVMARGDFILRNDVELFEKNISKRFGIKHVVGVNSGTDALYLSLKALNLQKGDEVITTALLPYSIFAILNAGATPILVDVKGDFNMDADKLYKAIKPRTKAIIPVHLNGRCCEIEKIMYIANTFSIPVIEDAAQSIGSKYRGGNSGTFGLCGCFSVHPMKNLSCAGDGGFITTNDKEFAEKLRALRNLGKKTKTEFASFGYNSRLDNLQAALLNVKLKNLNKNISRRRGIASEYNKKLFGLPLILPEPPSNKDYFDTYNSYIIRCNDRDKLFKHLIKNGIEAFVHYPKPIHQIEELRLLIFNLPITEKICKEAMSLPINPSMNEEQVDYVVHHIRTFFAKDLNRHSY